MVSDESTGDSEGEHAVLEQPCAVQSGAVVSCYVVEESA